VELLLNGKSLGSKDMPRLGHLEWSVPYAPGTLEARGYNGSEVMATTKVETTGPPASIRLRAPARARLIWDGEEVVSVSIEVLDGGGRIVPTADNLIHFQVENGSIAGVGNGDPSSHEPDKATQRHAFNGRCLALVRAGGPGLVTLKATSPGLHAGVVRIYASGG
jgi:beta-galactosidase